MEEKDEKKNNTHQSRGKKKNKKQTIDLSEFLSNDVAPAGFSAVPSARCNWADLMNDEDTDDYSPSWNKKNDNNIVILPNAPKAIRGPDIDLNLVPVSPPFHCYLYNLPYEATSNDVQKFFGKLKVFNIEFIKENAGGRMRNYVRVEFEDRDSLIDGLAKNQSMMKNRYIKVSLNSPENERENYRKERERERERDTDRDDRTSGDWRARKPEDKSVGQFSSSNRSYNNSSYFNRNRNDYNSRNNDQNSYNDRVSKDREQEKYPEHLAQSNNNRKAYLNNFLRSISPLRVPSTSTTDQVNEDKEQVQVRPKLQLTKALDHIQQDLPINNLNENKLNENDDTSSIKSKDTTTNESNITTTSSGPTVRKKLVLLPPSKKENTESQEIKVNSSIFGEAKPVDTTKRLLEIDEKTKQNEKELEKLVIDVKTIKKDNRDWSGVDHTRSNNYKRGSESGSQTGSSFRENLDTRDRFDRGDERVNKFDDWSYRNRNNNDTNNNNRRATPTSHNYNNYNRDNRGNNNNSTRRYNGANSNSNNNSNRNWNNNENSDRQLPKKTYDEDRNRDNNNFRLNNNTRVNNKPRNDGNYSMNKFDLLKEGEMA